MKPRAFALANNDYVHVAWDFGEKLKNCDGFAVFRIEKGGNGNGTPLPTFGRDKNGKRLKVSCEEEPIRKYNWRDVFEKRGQTFRYRVVAMAGPNKPMPGIDVAESNWVDVTSEFGKVEVYFNRGILATQRVSDIIWNPTKKKPDFGKIEKMISDPKSKLRRSLSGQLFGALTKLLDRAKKEGGSCWGALYELTDPILIDKLAECDDLHLILANNNGEKTENGKKITIYDGKNEAGAKALKNATELIRRYMPTGQIGHNKFMVYVDKNKQPRAVLTGSTNWTPSGLCTQSNNAILIESKDVAKQFLKYWEDLKADALNVGVPKKPAAMKGIQGKVLRGQCAKSGESFKVNGDATVSLWYSPNAPGLVRSVKKGAPPPKTPIDMSEVYKILSGAKQSILFLAFMPGKANSEGSFHFLRELATVATKKPGLFVRGAVSDPDLTREFDFKVLSTGPNENAMITSPQGIFKEFEKWREEIYKYGHAIIHDKTIVVDPFSKNCAVITGSHNLGFRASSNNDENMLIIRGDQAVAAAYTAHIMDIFEHYRARWITFNRKKNDYDPRKDPKWQDRYFEAWRPAFAERLFWIADGKPIPALLNNPNLKKAFLAAQAAEKRRAAIAAAKKAAKAATKSTSKKAAKKATKKAAKKSAKKGAKKTAKKAGKKTTKKGS